MARPSYHWLRLRAVAHPTEDVGRVRDAVAAVAGMPPAEAAAALTEERLETHHGLPLTLVEARVERAKDVRAVLDRVFALPGALDGLRRTLDSRVDEDGILYLRLDKQAAAQGTLRLADQEDAVQVRVKPEAHPATRAAALGILSGVLEAGRA